MTAGRGFAGTRRVIVGLEFAGRGGDGATSTPSMESIPPQVPPWYERPPLADRTPVVALLPLMSPSLCLTKLFVTQFGTRNHFKLERGRLRKKGKAGAGRVANQKGQHEGAG